MEVAGGLRRSRSVPYRLRAGGNYNDWLAELETIRFGYWRWLWRKLGWSRRLRTLRQTAYEATDALNFIKVFGFFRGEGHQIYFFLMGVVAVFVGFAGIINHADLGLGFETNRPRIFFNVHLPVVFLAIPPVFFRLRIISTAALVRFFLVRPTGNVGLAEDLWIVKVGGFGVSILLVSIEAILLASDEGKFFWKFIRFTLWSYFMSMYVITSAVVLLGIKKCANETRELSILLETDADHHRKIDRVRQLTRMLARFSDSIALYVLLQLLEVSLTICLTIGLLYRLIYFEDESNVGMGGHHYVMLSIVQFTSVWTLLVCLQNLNSKVRRLVNTAVDVHIDALPTQDNVAFIQGLKSVVSYIKHNLGEVSIFGWKVDVTFLTMVGATHLAFVLSVISSIQFSPQKTPKETLKEVQDVIDMLSDFLINYFKAL